MGNSYMADTDVQRELQTISDRIKHHDTQLDKLTDVSIKQVVLTEKLIAANTKIDTYTDSNNERMLKLENKVEDNKTTITRWGGGLAMLLILLGCGMFVMKMVESINS